MEYDIPTRIRFNIAGFRGPVYISDDQGNELGTPLKIPRKIVRRIRKSFAYRSGAVYKNVLKILPAPRVKKKGSLGIPLLTMCGREYLLLLEQMLFTIATRWSLIPNVVVVSDGSATLPEIRKSLRWWPAGLEVIEWEKLRDFHKDKGRTELVEYAEKDVFGRKLSSILGLAEQTRLLWCDSDVLFFSDFSALIDKSPHQCPFLETAEDSQFEYDLHLTATKLKHLYSRPPVNTGLILCEGNLHDACNLSALIKEGLRDCMYLTEQTILADAVYQVGKIGWALQTVEVLADDESSIVPTHLDKQWVARHYVGPIRHLFWRDALAMRLGLGKSA